MSYDLLIKNGTVVDGSGAPRLRADVAIAGGKIAAIGKVREGAKRVIDASELIVAPGFIDPHTHYDAQIWWDPLITCSSWHGVTSVVMGNCGVGMAPCRPTAREILTWDLVNIEGIPFDVLTKGVPWEWESFPEYMGAAQKRGTGINVGFLAPLTPFRHYVMGEESMERAARPEEISQIKALLREAVALGALGFSTTNPDGLQHIGYKGRPLACQLASREELRAYANALKELGKGTIEVVLTLAPGIVSEGEYAFLDFLLTESGRPVTWLALLDRNDQPTACMETLRKVESLVKRGGIPQVTCQPLLLQLNLSPPSAVFQTLRSWQPAFNQPVEAQKQLYRDPGFRQAFRTDLKTSTVFSRDVWERVEVQEVLNPALKSLEGKSVAAIARERGQDALDTFLDIALEDDLKTQYLTALFNTNEERLAKLVADPRAMIGLSDGGAHVDMICDAGYCTRLLGTWVREKEAMSLEYAVKRITTEPAAFFGLADRGRLAVGLAADVVLFDYHTVGAGGREWRYDLPGGARRLVVPAQGIQSTIVNGQVLYENQQHTGALPGQVLRSGGL